MSKLDTNHVVNLDLVKDRVNSVIKFGLADVETSDFYLGLYNNGSRVFDKDYIVTLYIVKPNGTFRNIKLEPKEGLKKYYCNLPDTLKNIPGEYVCQVMVFDNLTNEKKISKSKFKYSVSVDLASEMAGIIDEEEQESILTNILNRLLTLENPVEPYATQKHVDECVSTLTEEIDTIKVKDIEQDERLVNIESKNTEQDERLNAVETKNNEQDNRLVNIESKNTEQDNRLNTIKSKDIEQDERLNSLENKVDGIDEKIVDTIEPTLVNHGNRVDALENKDLVHESRMTDIEFKNVEQDNRLTSIEEINTTQNNRLDALETKDIAHESRMANIETKNTEQDNRLNSLESKDLIHESRLTNIESKNIEQDERLSNIETKDTEQDNRLDIAENRLANIGNDITNIMQPIIDEHTSRLDAIEAIDVSQNNRLDAIEVKNQEQDDRLLDIEKVNNKQDIDIKCLYGASQTIDVTKEGNSIYLQNSNNGFTVIDEIKGNTLVNCNKEPNKELILNGNINASADNAVTITEGVDGGLVDVALEGNTLVNVSKTKDSTALPLDEELTYLYANTQYTLQFVSDKATTADITLGGTSLLAQSIVKGLNRITITTPATLANNKLVISGVGANISEVVVTDTDREFMYFEGMKSVGEGGNLVITSSKSDNSQSNTQQLTHEPLRAVGDTKDRYVLIDGKWYIDRNCGGYTFTGNENWRKDASSENIQAFITNDMSNIKSSTTEILSNIYPKKKNRWSTYEVGFDTGNNNGLMIYVLKSDVSTIEELRNYLSNNKISIVYVLATPVYEPIDYNPLEVYSGITHITTNSTIPCNIIVKNHGYNCLLKPNTTYTVASNLGLNTVTAGADIGDSCLRFMDTDTSDITTMKDVLVLEGDWTTKADLIPANFSGIESAFEQEYDAEKGKYKVNVKVANEDKSKENNITFYINEPLRGVGNVKDRVFIQDDKVVVERNCGEVILNGSENWHSFNDKGDFVWVYNDMLINKRCKIEGNYIFNTCISDNLRTYYGFNHISDGYWGNCVALNGDYLKVSLSKKVLNNISKDGLNEWLQQNPTKVVYQLAEPTYEEVEYNDTKLFIESFKNSTLFYNSNVPVTSKLYYSYSVPLVNTVAQTANVTDQQDSMIIDLATQCAIMEMYLM